MADKYLLQVTAGPSYDPTSHQVVAVNSGTPTSIQSSLCSANISVRIQNYRGKQILVKMVLTAALSVLIHILQASRTARHQPLPTFLTRRTFMINTP